MIRRWLVRWGLLLVIIVAGVAFSLPFLLPAPQPFQLPAQPPPQPEVRPPPPAPTSRYASDEGELPAPDLNVTEPGAEYPPETVPSRAPVPELQPPAPPVVSTSPASPPPPPATRPSEFDRSQQSRQRGVEQFGGTPQTESAVELGLAWLAGHQSPNGIWDRFRFLDLEPRDDRSGGRAIMRTETSLDAGLTGLCLLAFLGAGYTDQAGPYQDVVRKAVDALLALQKKHGGFGPEPEDGMAGYNDSVATFALAEYYAMTRQPRCVEPLRRAVDRLVRNQQQLGGWDYLPSPNTGRNDTSITAWVVQALHACAAADIAVPRTALVKAALHFTHAAEADGHVRYADAGTGLELEPSGRVRYRFGPAMTAAGLTCEQLLGWRPDGPMPLKQAVLLLAQPPSSVLFRGRDKTELHSEYYWYYGTVAMFQRGGRDWDRWNGKLRDTLLPLQNREKTAAGKKRSAYGSWDPYGDYWGKWGKMGGRVYTTAICVLTLEIYYRHTPAYLTEDVLFDAEAWREYLSEANQRERFEAVSCLAALKYEIGEPPLVDLLKDEDGSVALAAAEALVMIDSPMGITLLEETLSRLPPWGRQTVNRALGRAREIAKLPPVEGKVVRFDPQQRVAMLELPRAYVGMHVSVRRDDHEVCQLRVTRRFSAHHEVIAVATGGAHPGDEPHPGDVAIGR